MGRSTPAGPVRGGRPPRLIDLGAAAQPGCRVIGVEPAGADDAGRSFRPEPQERWTTSRRSRTRADARPRGDSVRDHPPERGRYRDGVGREVVAAMRPVERMKLVIGRPAPGLRRLRSPRPGRACDPSGGNVDVSEPPDSSRRLRGHARVRRSTTVTRGPESPSRGASVLGNEPRDGRQPGSQLRSFPAEGRPP